MLRSAEALEMTISEDAIIVGLPGSLISLSAGRSLSCNALMIPPVAESPDPEGADIVLEALLNILPILNIDISSLMLKADDKEACKTISQDAQAATTGLRARNKARD